MVELDVLTAADRAELRATRQAWRQHIGSDTHRQAMQDVVIRLTSNGIRHQTIAVALGVTSTTVANWHAGRVKPRRTNHAYRPLEDDELAALRLLLAEIPRNGKGYCWNSPPGHDFLTAAHRCINDGVPTLQLAEQITTHVPASPGAIARKLTNSTPRIAPRRASTTRTPRARRTPDTARTPRASRRVTTEEWARLLALHDAVPQRSGRYPADRRTELEQPLVARNREIHRLWLDRVSDAHIADLLGLCDATIIHARRHARRLDDTPAQRCPAERQQPRTTRHLSAAHAELLAAAHERVASQRRQHRNNPYVPVFARLVADQHRAGVTLTEIAAAVGISRRRLATMLAARPTLNQ